MADEELEFVKRCMSVFIDKKIGELSAAKKDKRIEEDDVEILLEQIREFLQEHFGEVPNSISIGIHQLSTDIREVLTGMLQPTFHSGGFICRPIPSLFETLSNSAKKLFSMPASTISKILNSFMEKKLDEIWPEYKDRWRD